MDSLGFDGYMWTSDPEYSDSELRSSRSQWWLAMNCVRLHRLTQLKSSPMQAGGWCMCDQWPSDARDNKCCWDDLGLLIILDSTRPHVLSYSSLQPYVIYSVGNELLIVLLASKIHQPTLNLQSRPTSYCIILHEKCRGATPTKYAWWYSVILVTHFTLCPQNHDLC